MNLKCPHPTLPLGLSVRSKQLRNQTSAGALR